MTNNELKKFVFEDNNSTKVLKGKIIEEDDFTYKIDTLYSGVVILGKRAIIKISDVVGDTND